jgi:ABC-type nitrate/sulfonate/bicarbonate transport system substrate-binding protein
LLGSGLSTNMRKKLITVCALLFLLVVSSPAFGQLKKIRFSITSVAMTDLQFKIAELKGFYREEGLHVETILIRGSVGLQALLGGSVDYSSAAGSVIAAAVRGVPVKLVLIVNARPQFDLVTQPQIKSIQQFKGKLIGISSRGGAVDLLTQLILTRNGLTPDKDATLLVIGAPEELMLALRTGRIAAALLTLPRPLLLAREGFNRLAYSGDYLSSYPSGGIGVSEEKIKTHPSEVLGFVRASLRGLQYYTQNRAESVEIIAKHLGIKDRSLAAEAYDLHLTRLGAIGPQDDVWTRGAIDFTKKSLGVAKEVAPNQVFDFSFAEKAMGRIRN